MGEAGDAGVGWRQLRGFADVDLCRSYVLSWHLHSETLVIDVDLCLESTHPFYETPRPAERACIRPAALEFPHCDDIRLARDGEGQPIELTSEIGLGAIADLRVSRNHHYAISGEFGTVSLIAERPILRLKGP